MSKKSSRRWDIRHSDSTSNFWTRSVLSEFLRSAAAAMPVSRDLPTSLEPSSLTAGEAGDFKCLRDPPQAPCLRRPGLFFFGLHATRYYAIQRLPLCAKASLYIIRSHYPLS